MLAGMCEVKVVGHILTAISQIARLYLKMPGISIKTIVQYLNNNKMFFAAVMHFGKCLSVLFILTESYLIIVLYMQTFYFRDNHWSRCRIYRITIVTFSNTVFFFIYIYIYSISLFLC